MPLAARSLFISLREYTAVGYFPALPKVRTKAVLYYVLQLRTTGVNAAPLSTTRALAPARLDQLCAGLTSYRRELQLHTHDTYLRIECLLTLGLCTTNRALQPRTRSLEGLLRVVTRGPMCLVLRPGLLRPGDLSTRLLNQRFAYGACSFAAVRKLSARFSSSATGASAAASSLSTRERSSSLDSDAM